MDGSPYPVLGSINNVMGTFLGVGVPPEPGTTQVTVTANLANGELTDPSNALRLTLYYDFGQGRILRLEGEDWQGGPGQTAPVLTSDWSRLNPPQKVYAEVENGVSGARSPVRITSVTLTFA